MTDYHPIMETNNAEKMDKMKDARPELKTIEKKCRGDNQCICGKKDLVNLCWIQKKHDKLAPLILVGSCCVKKFIPVDEKTKSRLLCVTCQQPYRHNKYYVECPSCRATKQTHTPCTKCFDPTLNAKWKKWDKQCWTCYIGDPYGQKQNKK
jgi:hypothetical protein